MTEVAGASQAPLEWIFPPWAPLRPGSSFITKSKDLLTLSISLYVACPCPWHLPCCIGFYLIKSCLRLVAPPTLHLSLSVSERSWCRTSCSNSVSHIGGVGRLAEAFWGYFSCSWAPRSPPWSQLNLGSLLTNCHHSSLWVQTQWHQPLQKMLKNSSTIEPSGCLLQIGSLSSLPHIPLQQTPRSAPMSTPTSSTVSKTTPIYHIHEPVLGQGVYSLV